METRFQQGWNKLREIDGAAGESVVQSLSGIAPSLGKYIIEFAFGDIYSRPGLSLPQRQLVTLASLTTQGDCEPQLEVHINAALNVGLTPNQIIETMLHCAPYVGFPRVINAVKVGQKVFAQRQVQPVWGDEHGDGSGN